MSEQRRAVSRISRLYLSPTHDCNCRCEYCYVPPELKRSSGEAGEDFFLAVLEDFILRQGNAPGSFFDPQLRFIGGEPYLRFALMEKLIHRFSRRFPRSLVLINTNGTLINETTVAPFRDKRETVQHVVSLDGPGPVHNARRAMRDGGDGFQQTTAGIALLRRHSLPVKVNAVIDPANEHALADLMRLIKDEWGLTDISISLRQSPRRPLDDDDRFRLLSLAYALAEKHGLAVTGHHRLLLGSLIPALRCRAGEISVLVTSDKKATGCQRFLLDEEQLAYSPEIFHRAGLVLAGYPEKKCYSPKDRTLGARLYELYQQRYPQYVRVNDTDRIVFGII